MNPLNELNEKFVALEGQLKQMADQLRALRELPSTPLEIRRLAAQDCAKYVFENYPAVGVMQHRHQTLDAAVRMADDEGLYVEFGVHTGGTITSTAKKKPHLKIWGFDSFEGLPENWSGAGKMKGAFSLGGQMPEVPDNVTLVKGWFDETIPKWKAEHEGPISYCHIDCDLYSSTATVFTELEDRFRPGTILLFDDYFGYADWRNGEHKAFMEMLERTGFDYEAQAVSHMALVVKLTERS
ncbi:MAG: TylF/MycF/NovP-related O-methyltransferase [Pseudomonadota bacterium]